MLCHHRDIVALTPDLELFHRRRTEGISGSQHDRFTLSLILTRHFTDGGGFTDTVDADHQDHIRLFIFNFQRLIDCCQDFAHFFAQFDE
ncbi:Uncharacterised protein [Klebsiella pneumoniae]|nr:Uncharacterised protein [Klebsiella pneumoniae]